MLSFLLRLLLQFATTIQWQMIVQFLKAAMLSV